MKLDPEIACRLTDPGPVCIVVTETKDGPRLMSACWVTQVSFNPAIMMLAIGEKRGFAKDLQLLSKVSVNIPTEELLPAVLLCGGKLKRPGDALISREERAEELARKGWHLDDLHIRECAAWIDGTVVRTDRVGDHHLFFLAIDRVEVQDRWFDQELKVWNQQVRLVRNYGAGVLRCGF